MKEDLGILQQWHCSGAPDSKKKGSGLWSKGETVLAHDLYGYENGSPDCFGTGKNCKRPRELDPRFSALTNNGF